MAERRRDFELSVERRLGPEGPAGATVRLSVRLEVGPEGARPSPQELARELDALQEDLNALVGPPIAAMPAGRADRELSELVETYRPRQRELVDLLLDEGELTPREHARLAEYLGPAGTGAGPAVAPASTPETERLIATVPIDRATAPAPRSGGGPALAPPRPAENVRPVAELLQTYQISNLRQAGAVRARRQISFAEYMALKRHFEAPAKGSAEPGSG